MGDKTAARRAAVECNVPIVPGTNHALKSAEEAKEFANRRARARGAGGNAWAQACSRRASLPHPTPALSPFGAAAMIPTGSRRRPHPHPGPPGPMSATP
jgi:hypothetical protein